MASLRQESPVALNAGQYAFVFGFALLLFLSAWSQTAWTTEDIWNRPSFSTPPAELLAAASAVSAPADSDYIILLDETKYSFAEDGTDTRTLHQIFRILTPSGAKSWNEVESPWRMWREEKPQIRARVITLDGVDHPLDSKTITEAPVDDENPGVFTDQRLVRAPLPAINAGSVVEQEIVVPGKRSLLSNGVVHYENLGSSVPTHLSRVLIDAPAGLPIHYKTLLMDGIKPRRTESGNRVQLVFDAGPLDALKSPEPLLPPDIQRFPEVAFSTGKSWQDVAAHYSQILEPQIRTGEVQSLVARATAAGKTRKATIEALLSMVRSEIRYTGVEFGEASWIPRSPAETLNRKYGDCKDKSALLVAMLRAAGIPAHLALLTTATNRETVPDLPGLGQFNHAIVFVPGSPDIWIDATSDYSRVGQLPLDDQGRLALIIRPETSALVKTPESESKDNREVETREFFLQEFGPARIVEITESYGGIEEAYRDFYALQDPKETQKEFRDYGRNTYLAKEPVVGTFSPPGDFTTPFRLRIEMPKAGRGATDRREAVAVIFISQIASRLPYFFRTAKDFQDDSEGAAADRKEETANRIGDLLLPEPFVTEWRYKVVPPPGYKARQLPESTRTEIGPALLTREYAMEADGAVSAVFRFDTRKRRLTPKETDALIAAVKDLQKEEYILLAFDQVGEALLEEGKVREALAEFKRLSTMHPQESLHHAQIARALLAAGIGEVAREEAHRGVQLEPKSAQAYDTLGETLEYDLIGRRFGKGFDLEGATAARRKAVELDPDSMEFKLGLAILLEHNELGERYKSAARLKEAIGLYKSLAEELKGTRAETNFAIARLWAGQFEDLKKDFQPSGTGKDRTALMLVAVAATEGSAAAIRKVVQYESTEDARREVLRSAADTLVELRMYAQAAELLKAGARGISNAAAELSRAAVLAKVQRREELKHSDSEPQSAFYRLMALMLAPEVKGEDIALLFSHFNRDEAKDPKKLDSFRQIRSMMRAGLTQAGVSVDVLADIVFSSVELHADGDDSTGYVISAQLPGNNMKLFVAKEQNRYVALGANEGLEDVGKLVLELLRAGETKKARIWLDRALEELKPVGGDDPLAGRAFPRLWLKGQEASPEQMRLAAAALISKSDDALLSIPVLLEARSSSLDNALGNYIDIALLEAYRSTQKWQEGLAVARRLYAAAPTSREVFLELAAMELKAGNLNDCEQLAVERLKTLPKDIDAMRMLRSVAEARPDWKKAALIGKQIAESGNAEPGDFNNQAWNTLFDGSVGEEALEIARKAAMLSNNARFGILHTLASIQAELGHTMEAREVLLHAMQVGGVEEPNSSCWYVLGRIDEQFGELDAALSAYKKVIADEDKAASPTGTIVLAQKRISTIQSLQGNK